MAARELSFGVGAKGEDEEDEEDAKGLGEADEEGVALLEADEEERDVVWRAFEARLLVSPF